MREIRVPKNSTVLHIETAENAPQLVVLEENAQFHHVRVVGANSPAVQVNVAANASYKLDYVLANAANAEQKLVVDLQAPNAYASIHGVQLASSDVYAGSNILVRHLAPHCASRQFVRNILAGQAKLGFVGKVYVDQVAQKTDGYQLCNSILLSEKAEVKTRPELEIYADDVKCSHGNTVGKLDDTALFYLTQRGLSRVEAKKMLLESFLAEVLESEQAATHLLPMCLNWLNSRFGLSGAWKAPCFS
jgi:Fe-S cluster assembly protein SufD